MNIRAAPPASARFLEDNGRAWAGAALMVAATLLAYSGTFAVPFVLDDATAITGNDSIRHWASAWSPPPDTTVTGRPVVNLSLALNYAIGGLDVRGYHVANLAIHLLAALVLFGVIRRSLANPRVAPALASDATLIASATSLLWAVHPLQTESVTYTIQRAESLMGLFYLLTLYTFLRGTSAGAQSSNTQTIWLGLSFAVCLLGMGTKEVTVSVPLLVLLYDRMFVAGSFRAAWHARRVYYVALASTWIALGALVIAAQGRNGTAGLATKIAPLDYALTQCHAIVHYLRLAFWPTPLVFDYGRATATQLSTVLAPALLLLALVASTLIALRARPALGFLGVWFFVLLAPSSSVVPIATQTMAEHRLYLSLAALATLAAGALYRSLGRRVMLAATLVAATGLTALTLQRNTVYRDPLSLWADTHAKAPDNPRATTNLGLALLQQGKLEEAQRLFHAEVERHPDLVEPRINFATALSSNQRFDEAAVQLEAALRIEPNHLEAHNNLGIALAQSGRALEAIAHFERALQIKPASADSHRNLGLALAQSGRPEKALAQLAEAARLQPRDPLNRDFHGFALLRLRRFPEAIREFEAALSLDPTSAVAHHHLGVALSRAGRTTEALAQLEQATQRAPDNAMLRNDLGLALAGANRVAEARAQFEHAVRLRPDFAEAVRNLARARAEASSQ